MTKKLVIDSDAIYAVYNHNDPLHSKAVKTLEALNNNHFQLIYPTSVIFEVVSLFQRVLSSSVATTNFIEMIKDKKLLIHAIDHELLKESTTLFKPAGSKKNTLVDCSVAAVTKKIKADGVFSYDGFYTKQGLRLAEDLFTG